MYSGNLICSCEDRYRGITGASSRVHCVIAINNVNLVVIKTDTTRRLHMISESWLPMLITFYAITSGVSARCGIVARSVVHVLIPCNNIAILRASLLIIFILVHGLQAVICCFTTFIESSYKKKKEKKKCERERERNSKLRRRKSAYDSVRSCVLRL